MINNIRKILVLILGCLPFLSTPSAQAVEATGSSEPRQSGVILRFWNHDVGPVKDGTFLRDQMEFNKRSAGKLPGSGLFQLSYDSNYAINEDCLPLFGLHPIVLVQKSNGSTVELNSDHKLALGLPGTPLEIPTGVDAAKIEFIQVRLVASRYGFTTSGGSVWTNNCTYKDIVRPAIAMTDELRVSTDFVLSWPVALATEESKARLVLKCNEVPYTPTVTRDMLIPNWKKDLMGMNVDGTNPEAPLCYPTRGFNRAGTGNISENMIPAGISLEDMPYVAGHKNDADPFASSGSAASGGLAASGSSGSSETSDPDPTP